jgi:type II restriction enzyme
MIVEPGEYIRELAQKYGLELEKRINNRMKEMKEDDRSHYLIYQVLGITNKEGELIDLYQNKGRFLYNYAGSFLEETAIFCIQHKHPNAEQKVRVQNTLGRRPKTFEIDCLVDNQAFEIKWRDATTDGDHITKEHTRAKVIKGYGFKPIRIMFYYPNRQQAIRIQDAIKTMYLGLDGEYYSGDDAWEFLSDFTNINLKAILEDIAQENLAKQG